MLRSALVASGSIAHYYQDKLGKGRRMKCDWTNQNDVRLIKGFEVESEYSPTSITELQFDLITFGCILMHY